MNSRWSKYVLQTLHWNTLLEHCNWTLYWNTVIEHCIENRKLHVDAEAENEVELVNRKFAFTLLYFSTWVNLEGVP